MTVELDREAIARVSTLPAVVQAAEAGSALIALWPLTDAMQMDNDAKYAENLQVRITRAFARILTGEDVTVPDAEFVYEGADEIPGRPQRIVDTLLAANDAYDTMSDYSETGDTSLVFAAAEALGIDWDPDTAAAVKETIAAVEAQVACDAAADGRLSASSEPSAVAGRFAAALAVCDALLGVVCGRDADAAAFETGSAAAACSDAAADAGSAAETGSAAAAGSAAASETIDETAARALPIMLYVNELREQCSIPRICLTDDRIRGLVEQRAAAADTLTVTAQAIAPLAQAEWTKHRDDVLWNPDEAKKKAKEDDEKRSKEALAAKFAHVKDDPHKQAVEL
jgi:hypothetical protein